MKVKQKVEFGIRSFTIPATEITARLLIEPDATRVLGSRATVPKQVPVAHGWYVVCDKPGLCVDEQFLEVMTRVEPAADRIRALVDELRSRGDEASARVSVVRTFSDDDDDTEGEGDDGGVDIVEGNEFVRLGGQHQLLGWYLDRRALDFLQRVGAHLDVDEYG